MCCIMVVNSSNKTMNLPHLIIKRLQKGNTIISFCSWESNYNTKMKKKKRTHVQALTISLEED